MVRFAPPSKPVTLAPATEQCQIKSELIHIKAVGAYLLYLPPYSPDLNPIEQAFAKLKALLRKTSARTVDELWQAIADLLDHFPPEECTNYIRNSGYGFNQP